MRKESKTFAMRALLVLTAVCLVLCMLVACNKIGNVESIEVDEESNAGYYMLEGFNISTLRLRVNYEDGTPNYINVEKPMLTTAAQNELKTGGQKEITINYKGKTTTVSFYLAAEGEQVVEVTFKDVNNNKITSVKTLVGGNVTANPGSYAKDGLTGTWSGDPAESVTLTMARDAENESPRLTSIKVTYQTKED